MPIGAGELQTAGTSSTGCTVTVTSAPPAWAAFLRGRPDATVYHDPRWGQVMAAAYGNRPFYLTARRGGRVVGTLMLVLQRSMLFGAHLSSLPYFDASGLLAADEAAGEALLAAARDLRRRCRAEWVELRQMQPLTPPLPARTDKVTLWLPLPRGAPAAWQQLKTKVRTKVRKSQAGDLAAAGGGGELLKAFCAVYARTMRDLGSPPHGRRFFAAILGAFGPAVRLFVVRAGDRPLAAALTLRDHAALRVPWSGSDRRFRRLGANRLLYWTMLAHAADAGAPTFDFGRSSRDSGTYQFKREWGARPVPLYWHYLLPEGRPLPQLRPDSTKYRAMVACWRRLPTWAARLLGPRLIAKLV
jgi:FemAB-related protein (PEP-CTERM system-associated)